MSKKAKKKVARTKKKFSAKLPLHYICDECATKFKIRDLWIKSSKGSICGNCAECSEQGELHGLSLARVVAGKTTYMAARKAYQEETPTCRKCHAPYRVGLGGQVCDCNQVKPERVKGLIEITLMEGCGNLSRVVEAIEADVENVQTAKLVSATPTHKPAGLTFDSLSQLTIALSTYVEGLMEDARKGDPIALSAVQHYIPELMDELLKLGIDPVSDSEGEDITTWLNEAKTLGECKHDRDVEFFRMSNTNKAVRCLTCMKSLELQNLEKGWQ